MAPRKEERIPEEALRRGRVVADTAENFIAPTISAIMQNESLDSLNTKPIVDGIVTFNIWSAEVIWLFLRTVMCIHTALAAGVDLPGGPDRFA